MSFFSKNIIKSSQPYFSPKDIDWITKEIESILKSGVLTCGENTKIFERNFADCIDVDYAVSVSSGTTALDIILRNYTLDGGEVIVPTNTFIASANAVIFAGGVPVLADIDPSSLCLGLSQIKERVTQKTRGVMVVHIAGLVCPQIEKIKIFCRENNLFIIEDAAHAHGAKLNGMSAGSITDAGAFSFFPTKPLTTSEGGMITTNCGKLAEFSRTFRSHGVPSGKRVHEEIGHNYRLNEISAVLGISQLKMLEQFTAIRRNIASSYVRELSVLKEFGIDFISSKEDIVHSYYKFPVVMPSVKLRNTVSGALKNEKGIDTGTVYWPPCHLQPIVKKSNNLYKVMGNFPAAEDILPRIICLPIHVQLTEGEVCYIADAVKLEVKKAI